MKNRPIIDIIRKIFRKLTRKSSVTLAKLRTNILWAVHPRKATTDKNYGHELIIS